MEMAWMRDIHCAQSERRSSERPRNSRVWMYLFLYVKRVAGVDYASTEEQEEKEDGQEGAGEGDRCQRVSRVPLSRRTLFRTALCAPI